MLIGHRIAGGSRLDPFAAEDRLHSFQVVALSACCSAAAASSGVANFACAGAVLQPGRNQDDQSKHGHRNNVF